MIYFFIRTPDRGVQYACNEFRDLLNKNSLITRSMSRKGNCWDNTVAESFFKTLKVECVYQNRFTNKEQVALAISPDTSRSGTTVKDCILHWVTGLRRILKNN